LDKLENASIDELITVALGAMKKAQDFEINAFNTAVSVVGRDQEYKILSSDEMGRFLDSNQMDIA
jgi:hypothetical protein